MKTMGVWNAKILYTNVWNLSMVLYGYMSWVVWDLLSSVWKSIDFRTTSMKTMCVCMEV